MFCSKPCSALQLPQLERIFFTFCRLLSFCMTQGYAAFLSTSVALLIHVQLPSAINSDPSLKMFFLTSCSLSRIYVDYSCASVILDSCPALNFICYFYIVCQFVKSTLLSSSIFAVTLLSHLLQI